MPAFNGKAPYAPEYASYNWIGAPSNYGLTTNKDLGGDSRMCCSDSPTMTGFLTKDYAEQAPKISTNGSNPVIRPT